jgi:enterobactin synthetase component D / holo-[acyl-carrier protein] synthase
MSASSSPGTQTRWGAYEERRFVLTMPDLVERGTGGVVRAILPDDVAVAELAGCHADYVLAPEEIAALGPVKSVRRLEFARGRRCAHEALGRLDPHLGTSPILIGKNRQPIWPANVRGSITHCRGYAAAAVVRAVDYLAVGIDVEPDLPLPSRVRERILTAADSSDLAELEQWFPNGPAWDRLVFCAKEAAYKAWYPVERTWLDFHDAVVTIDPVRSTFEAAFVGARTAGAVLMPRRITGRLGYGDGFIGAAVAVRHR